MRPRETRIPLGGASTRLPGSKCFAVDESEGQVPSASGLPRPEVEFESKLESEDLAPPVNAGLIVFGDR